MSESEGLNRIQQTGFSQEDMKAGCSIVATSETLCTRPRPRMGLSPRRSIGWKNWFDGLTSLGMSLLLAQVRISLKTLLEPLGQTSLPHGLAAVSVVLNDENHSFLRSR